MCGFNDLTEIKTRIPHMGNPRNKNNKTNGCNVTMQTFLAGQE